MKYIFHVDDRSVADPGDEMAIQVRLRSRMKMLAPSVRLVATPNGMKTTAWSAMKAKAEGMSKGFPDLNALWSNGSGEAALPSIAFLEIKDRLGTIKPEQIDWMNWLHLSGFPCGVFRSADSAIDFLRRAGAPFSLNQSVAA